MLKYMNTYSHEEGLFSNIRVGLRRLVNNNCIDYKRIFLLSYCEVQIIGLYLKSKSL